MRILDIHNRGSITIEMCFVMPIVIGIIMMLINMMLKGVEEGTILGNSQMKVYEYSDLYVTQHSDGDIYVEADFIFSTGSKREWRVCTDRLRRWQLYGDVLCE